MVCDEVVCERVVCDKLCVTKLCVKDGVCVCDKVVCEKWCVKVAEEEREEEREAGGAGYRIKNKSPTQRCGEQY